LECVSSQELVYKSFVILKFDMSSFKPPDMFEVFSSKNCF